MGEMYLLGHDGWRQPLVSCDKQVWRDVSSGGLSTRPFGLIGMQGFKVEVARGVRATS